MSLATHFQDLLDRDPARRTKAELEAVLDVVADLVADACSRDGRLNSQTVLSKAKALRFLRFLARHGRVTLVEAQGPWLRVRWRRRSARAGVKLEQFADVITDYEQGMPLAEIAARHRTSKSAVEYAVASSGIVRRRNRT